MKFCALNSKLLGGTKFQVLAVSRVTEVQNQLPRQLESKNDIHLAGENFVKQRIQVPKRQAACYSEEYILHIRVNSIKSKQKQNDMVSAALKV